MPLDEDEWEDATKQVGMANRIEGILEEAHPNALSVGDITNEWDKTERTSDRDIARTLSEVLVSEGTAEIATVDGVAARYYRYVDE